ncbi:MAG: Holliday junction branch migration protein RuvA [Clostridiaceae bacterium]|nr:Holliday junction branch migration protein RuvA [Clostridiaceae bacterium]
MISYIKGKLSLIGENFVVLDVAGIGFRVFTSTQSLSQLPKINEEATLHTYLHIREDVMDLYGFATVSELNMFENLLSVNGVGPKAALSVLSVLSPSELALAIITDDAKQIKKAQGIGPKVAQRIIIDLKDKLKNSALIDEGITTSLSPVSAQDEAVEALIVLGYTPQEAKNAVSSVKKEGLSTEDTIKAALSVLMKK